MHKTLCATLVVVVVLLALPTSLRAQVSSRLPNDQMARIEALIQSQMTASKIPALSVAIVSDGQIRYAKGFGIADLENSVGATAMTAYRLGSMSKTITATGVLQLYERGKLDLDAPVQKYCPAFPEKASPVTSRQLLAHLGGVRDYNNQRFLEEYFSTRHYNNVTESLDIFKNDPLVHEPGTKYSYSTYGYNVLGCVIEGASATKYEDFIRENILKPAGMNQTGVDDIRRIIANRARGYRRSQNGELFNTGLADTSNKIPAGGLVSTVEDIGKFATALWAGQLLTSATIDQMWTAQKTKDGQAITYGLGWRLADRSGMKEVFHGGAAAGFSTFFYLLPQRKIAIVLMTNMEQLGSRERDEVARKLADIVAA